MGPVVFRAVLKANFPNAVNTSSFAGERGRG